MRPVKVMQVLECGGPGGTGEQVAALCTGLRPPEFETTLVYAVRPGASAEEYAARVGGAVKTVHIPEMVREISPIRDVKALFSLYRLFKNEKPDVVHAHSSKAGFLARWAALLARVPRIYYSPRGYSFQMSDRNGISRALYKILEWSVSWIGEIVAVSSSEAVLAVPLARPKHVHVVQDPYLGKLPALAARGENGKDGIKIGACGRLTYARNPVAFVKLAQRVTDSRNGVRLEWIGDGELAGAAKEMIRDMNLANRLEVTGWLDRADVEKRLLGMDIFVHYSRWEGLPGAVLEAMAAGLPVVASDIPGNRDAVVHLETGFLARSEVEALEFVLKLIDDPDIRRRMGEAGRRRVEKDFTVDATLSSLKRLYKIGRV
ncbi:MAG: glycosyltransferase family 4 protein [Elusimicrobia bacterium]|nr:glycosyltransferase family 4 protein [Elusimicrobiota bacterium]